MTEQVMTYYQFKGVQLVNGTTVRQVEPLEYSGDVAVSRIFRLSNGAKFDADGDADGDTMPGTIRATFRITETSHSAALTKLLALEALLNKKGTLHGNVYGATGWDGVNCTARCVSARPIARARIPLAIGRQYQIDVEMVWERFTAWV